MMNKSDAKKRTQAKRKARKNRQEMASKVINVDEILGRKKNNDDGWDRTKKW